MKFLCFIVSLFSLVLGAGAQGYVFFNTATVDAKFYNVDKTTPLSGYDYLAQLYSADGSCTDSSILTAKGNPVNFRSGVNAGYVMTSGVNSLGQTISSSVEVSSTPGLVTLQVRFWEGGTIPSYEQAVISGQPTGESTLFTLISSGPPSVPPNLVGLQSTLVLIPEPSTIALETMSLFVFLSLYRRKRNVLANGSDH